MCESFNTLPRPGSLFDQDAFLMYAIQAVTNARIERWNKDNPPPKGVTPSR